MKTNFKLVVFAFILFFQLPAFAQKEATFWYFGSKAGMQFTHSSNSIPGVLSDGKLFAHEGCATISDSTGKLLFYTSGDTVYNKQHKKMSNGWKLSGHQSATQSSIIIPQRQDSIHYLFTVDALGGLNGLKYSVVNTKALNGQGLVTAKNIPLITPISEKITAADHRYTKDVWVVVHGYGPQKGGNFYAYRVNRNGITGPPVISQVGTIHQDLNPSDQGLPSIGCMKISPDGRKLALAMQYHDMIEIFDFNDSSGVVSNPVKIKKLIRAYGIEFSPDSRSLFVSIEPSTAAILQFDMHAGNGNLDSIEVSKKTLGTSRFIIPGSLQLALNRNIYLAHDNNSYVSNITQLHAPDLKPTYRDSYVLISKGDPKRYSNLGLPSFNTSYFYVPFFRYTTVCVGDSTAFELLEKRKYKKLLWNFGDTVSGAANTSTLPNPKHVFSSAGTFYVRLTITLLNNKVRTNTVEVKVVDLPTFSLGRDTVICPQGKFVLNGPKNLKKYLWNTEEKTASIIAKKTGWYWLEGTSSLGCSYRDSIYLKEVPAIKLFRKKYYELCLGESIAISSMHQNPAWHWDNGSSDSVRQVTKAGWYKGYLEDSISGCTFTDSVEVAYKECLEMLKVPNIITPNGDNLNDTFTMLGLKPGDWHLQIYNRWGTLIYENKNYQNNWPENPPSDGTYFYYLRKPDSDMTFKGWLEIAR